MGDGADRTNRPWGRVLAATMVLQMLNECRLRKYRQCRTLIAGLAPAARGRQKTNESEHPAIVTTPSSGMRRSAYGRHTNPAPSASAHPFRSRRHQRKIRWPASPQRDAVPRSCRRMSLSLPLNTTEVSITLTSTYIVLLFLSIIDSIIGGLAALDPVVWRPCQMHSRKKSRRRSGQPAIETGCRRRS
jgi:hypothetical protein